jgi:xanthine dehydrogenase YagS FAD-binding subunit
MRPFVYESPSSAQEAASRSAPDSLFIAGGTTVIDLMKLEVMKPARLVDVNALPMRGVEMRRWAANRRSRENERGGASS